MEKSEKNKSTESIAAYSPRRVGKAYSSMSVYRYVNIKNESGDYLDVKLKFPALDREATFAFVSFQQSEKTKTDMFACKILKRKMDFITIRIMRVDEFAGLAWSDPIELDLLLFQ